MPPHRAPQRTRARLQQIRWMSTRRPRRLSHDELLDSRERFIDFLNGVGKAYGANHFFEKAMILLTRHWAAAPWAARGEILQTVDWLLRVGASGGAAGNAASVYPCRTNATLAALSPPSRFGSKATALAQHAGIPAAPPAPSQETGFSAPRAACRRDWSPATPTGRRLS
jgi:hypothetical protein